MSALARPGQPISDQSLATLIARTSTFGAAFQRHWFAQAAVMAPMAPLRQGRQLVCGLRLLAAHQGGRRFNTLCRRLAQRLRNCGLGAEHYDLAGAALLASLRDTLGKAYDEAAEGYWGALYGEAAEAMLASVADEPPAVEAVR